MKINKVLAFDIGGTKIAYATVDRNGKILNEVIRHPTPAAPGAAAKLLKTIIAQFEDQIDAVAVSTAGTVDRTNSRITGSVGNMPEGYMDTDFKALSAKPVVVENDANSAVWAEHVLGNAKGHDNVILLTLGTGVGVGIIADGRLLVGKSGAAGEVHFPVRYDNNRLCGCGRYDCLEIYMSGKALSLEAKAAYKDDNATSHTVIEGLKQNALPAVTAFHNWQEMVKNGIVIFADIFDPEVILLGGSMAHFIDYKRLNDEANRMIVTTPFELKEASFENDAGLIGAALLCVQKLEKKAV
ncbi:MAG: ROK family protein [Alphaproteobacteria bacterium]|jgi:glucokinase